MQNSFGQFFFDSVNCCCCLSGSIFFLFQLNANNMKINMPICVYFKHLTANSNKRDRHNRLNKLLFLEGKNGIIRKKQSPSRRKTVSGNLIRTKIFKADLGLFSCFYQEQAQKNASDRTFFKEKLLQRVQNTSNLILGKRSFF